MRRATSTQITKNEKVPQKSCLYRHEENKTLITFLKNLIFIIVGLCSSTHIRLSIDILRRYLPSNTTAGWPCPIVVSLSNYNSLLLLVFKYYILIFSLQCSLQQQTDLSENSCLVHYLFALLSFAIIIKKPGI